MTSRLSCAAPLLLFILFAIPIHAQPAFLVRDIEPQRGSDFFAESAPRGFMTVGGKLFFQTEELEGDGIWVTDGTPSGTRSLPDLCEECTPPRFVGRLGNLAFWLDSSPPRGDHVLVRSDGTRAGTFPLTDVAALEIEPPESGEDFPTLGGALFFPGCTEDEGCRLWRTDGTPAGTRVAVDASPGTLTLAGDRIFFVTEFGQALVASDGTPAGTSVIARSPSGSFSQLTAAGSKLFFVEDDSSVTGPVLWVSDGTAAGTRAVLDPPGNAPLSEWLKPLGSRVYLVANDITHGDELWRSDGTPAGSVRVTEFGFAEPFSLGLEPRDLEEVNGRLVFRATDGLTGPKLWATSGRPESTVALAPLCPEDCFGENRGLARTGNRIVFRAETVTHGGEPWSTDGTPAGTVRLADLCPGACSGMDSAPLVLGRRVYFASEGQLWVSDGRAAGTRRVTDFNVSQTTLSLPFEEIAALGPRVFFSAEGIYGAELWSATGRPGETQMVADLAPRGGVSSLPSQLTALGDRLLFLDQSEEIWLSLGTAPTTVALGAPAPGACGISCDPEHLTRAGNFVFFTSWESLNFTEQLWSTDGTVAGTRQLTSFQQGTTPLPPSPDPEFVEFQGKLFFFAGSQLWSSDGSAAGTGKVLDLPEGTRFPFELTAVGNELYFYASSPDGDREVWRSDGTVAGTRRLHRFEGINFTEAGFVRAGSSVYFNGPGSPFGTDLWKTDGTAAGTGLVKDDFAENDGPFDLTSFQGAVYFLIVQFDGFSLWRSDGTAAGTAELRKFSKETIYFIPAPEITVVGNRLFFVADEDAHGVELWQSDGTAQGTRIVRDIFPGAPSSAPSGLTVAGGRLFFTAQDGAHGRELWESDGTEAGTRLVHDIAPEIYSSFPEELTVAGNFLYFSADDRVHGVELWALPLSGTGACQPSPTALCLGGRFKVEAVWRDFAGNTGTGQAVALTPDTGYFWFFNPENVETVVKVLDGRGVNGHRWVFYGALSNVEYDLTVTDTETGLTRRYFNPAYRFASVGDTYGFGPLGAAKVKTSPASPPPIIKERFDPAAATGVCVPSATQLCLNGGRFAVEVSWKDFSNRTGVGTAVNLTPDTGYFWFFNAENVELMVKVLDGRPITGKFWVFYGALSNVEYTLTVTDTQTGISKEYKNAIGRFGSVGDTGAF